LVTSIVYVTGSPGVAGDGLADFRTATSALVATVTGTEPVLFPGFGSVMFDATDAVFVSTLLTAALAGSATSIVTVAEPPEMMVPREQLIVAAAIVQLGGRSAGVIPAGSGSVMTTPVASDGPAFVTVKV
jgi:hypothetical protein